VGGAFFRISRFLAAARLPWSFFAQIVPPGNVVMTIDNPFQSPNAESLENPGVVLHSRNNWTGYSPEYNAAPKTAMLVQAVLAVVTSLVPDFGLYASRIPGCVPLPMGKGLDHTLPTANAPNMV
jgi:hypothetical protein